MRHTLFCTVLLWFGACGRKRSVLDLPTPATTATQPAARGAFTVALGAAGRVLVGGRARSLDGLSALLSRTVRFDSPDDLAAVTVVRLRIDRAAPWAHVQWLVAILAQHNIVKTRFVYAGEVDLACRVWPASLLCLYPAMPDRKVVCLRVVVGPGGRVRCGELDAPSPAAVTGWLADAAARVHRENLAGIIAEILPHERAPWGAVAAVYERLRAAGAFVSRTLSERLRSPEVCGPTLSSPFWHSPFSSSARIGVGCAAAARQPSEVDSRGSRPNRTSRAAAPGTIAPSRPRKRCWRI